MISIISVLNNLLTQDIGVKMAMIVAIILTPTPVK